MDSLTDFAETADENLLLIRRIIANMPFTIVYEPQDMRSYSRNSRHKIGPRKIYETDLDGR